MQWGQKYFEVCTTIFISLFFMRVAPTALNISTYRTLAIIGRSGFEAALVYKLRILSSKNEEFPFLVHKLSVI